MTVRAGSVASTTFRDAFFYSGEVLHDDTAKALRTLITRASSRFKATYGPVSTQYEQAEATAPANASLPAEKQRGKPPEAQLSKKHRSQNYNENIQKHHRRSHHVDCGLIRTRTTDCL